jgi:hypothetical protein
VAGHTKPKLACDDMPSGIVELEMPVAAQGDEPFWRDGEHAAIFEGFEACSAVAGVP